jgi:hypothetical protein
MATTHHSIGSPPTYSLIPWPDTPENVITSLPDLHRGSAHDVILCVLLRAHAVTVLLNSEFADPERDRLKDYLIVNALWDIQGNLEIAQHLLSEREVRHG